MIISLFEPRIGGKPNTPLGKMNLEFDPEKKPYKNILTIFCHPKHIDQFIPDRNRKERRCSKLATQRKKVIQVLNKRRIKNQLDESLVIPHALIGFADKTKKGISREQIGEEEAKNKGSKQRLRVLYEVLAPQPSDFKRDTHFHPKKILESPKFLSDSGTLPSLGPKWRKTQNSHKI